jgi:hypothetical protein
MENCSAGGLAAIGFPAARLLAVPGGRTTAFMACFDLRRLYASPRMNSSQFTNASLI